MGKAGEHPKKQAGAIVTLIGDQSGISIIAKSTMPSTHIPCAFQAYLPANPHGHCVSGLSLGGLKFQAQH
jgi:hypothetical protein